MKEAESFKEAKESDLNDKLTGRDNSKLQRIGTYALILLIVFLLGFVPMWLSRRTAVNERDAAVRQLRASQLQNHLASAIVNARVGEYEPARQSASSFFTDLGAEIDRGEKAAFSAGQNQEFQPILSQRDEIITLLARNDPASVERLTNLYLAYVKVAGQVRPQ